MNEPEAENKTERPFAKSEVMQQLLGMMQKISAEPNNNARPDQIVPSSEISTDFYHTTEAHPESAESALVPVIPLVEDEDKMPVLSGSDTSMQGQDTIDDSNDDRVVETSLNPAPPGRGGFVRRWVKRAVSWIKRLVGF